MLLDRYNNKTQTIEIRINESILCLFGLQEDTLKENINSKIHFTKAPIEKPIMYPAVLKNVFDDRK